MFYIINTFFYIINLNSIIKKTYSYTKISENTQNSNNYFDQKTGFQNRKYLWHSQWLLCSQKHVFNVCIKTCLQYIITILYTLVQKSLILTFKSSFMPLKKPF